ncbi:MAG: phosphotransferase, partial [Planctomycetota bacterium]|nr:phosphotransferase [Planctomycetota bacterium]
MWRTLPSLTTLPGHAVDWIEAHLPAPCLAGETVRETARSTVVRLGTDDGSVYFKADHILPPSEATVLTRLAQSCPAQVAPLLGVDEERGWSLTRDAGPTGPTSLDRERTDVWRAVARAFGELQRNTGLGPEDWVALGCRDLRGPRLFTALCEMIEHAAPRLETADRDSLRRLLPRIDEACAELASDGLPATLVHQDLVLENLVWRAGQVVFLDWSDTVVGHPFFGLDRLLDSCW